AMERSMDRFYHALRPSEHEATATGGGGCLDALPFRQRFLGAMDDDLNTPQAIAALFDLARDINRERDSGRSTAEAQRTLRELGGVLGLTFEEPVAGSDELAAKPFIDLLVNTRTELRQARQFALADRIRDELATQGVVLEDSAQGTVWRYQRGA
ncbi:MAG: cysteine--tRNA ligase, partial [Chloroflexota bacterium]|nr:cysteine--tRNA ligase [Chloroflexota bacterium]